VGASIDSVNSHLAWQGTERKKGGLGRMKIPLIADIGGLVARQLGFLVENPEDELHGIALRGTVLVDPSGTIRHLTVNDAPVGRSVDEALRLVQAFQYTDKHGEVCPSGWAPGKKAIKPTAKATAEYLATLQ
jgi:alkyl hydroperoxide reductase subunit AhpC